MRQAARPRGFESHPLRTDLVECSEASMKIFKGTVIKGNRRGSELGYPTLNLAYSGEESGVFIAKVTVRGETFPAAAFADPSRSLLEAHIPGFSGDTYGEEAVIELVEKLRESKKFDSDDELKAAIADDVAKVRRHSVKNL